MISPTIQARDPKELWVVECVLNKVAGPIIVNNQPNQEYGSLPGDLFEKGSGIIFRVGVEPSF